MHAPALVQQFTHLVHPNRSHRLSYLLRKIADIHTKNEQTVYAIRHLSLQKGNDFTVDLRGQFLCFNWQSMLSSFAAAALSLVSQTPREQRLVVKYR